MKFMGIIFNFLVLTFLSMPGVAQINKVVVEKYYISDLFDASYPSDELHLDII